MKFSQIFSFGLCAALLLGTAACTSSDEPDKGSSKPPYKEIQISRAEQDFVETQNDFAAKFYLGIRDLKLSEDPNIAVSPLSASILMSIMATGAEGNTRSEIVETLGFADADIDAVNSFNARLANELISVDPSTAFSLANAAWFDKTITVKENFLNQCRDSYGMTAKYVDLATESTRNDINKWALDNTKGLVKDFIKSVGELRGMGVFLANALYFKGLWYEPFDKAATDQAFFHNADGTESTVDMMHHNLEGQIASEDNYSALELALGSSNYRMVFVLPAEGHDFTSVLAEIEGHKLPGLCEYCCEANISLPRFEIVNDEIFLNNVFLALGIKDLFDPLAADLSAMSDNLLFIADVKQSTHIIVNEDGAEAAAVTGATALISPGPAEKVTFTFDRPFGFYIYEHSTKAIIFMGDVNKL